MLRERKLFVLSILFLLTLSLASMPLTVALTASTDVQAKSINKTTDTFPSQVKIIREADVYQTSSEILYIWNWQHQDLYGVNKWIVIIYSEEYNETAGKYYYALTEAESIGGGTIGHITTTEWNVVWQKCLDMPIVWGRIADIDGDNLPEIITIPDVENLTIVYDDDGTQLTKFAIPDYRRALAVTDWTGDGIDDIILITGSYYDSLLGKHYLDVEVFDIYQNQTSTSSIYLPDDLVVGEAFVGDWQLSLQGMEIAVLETSLYYGDSHSMAILSASNTSATMINLPYKNTFRSDIALSENYLAFSFEDESTDKYGVAVLFNGSILWYYQTSYDIDGLEIAELDGDSKLELIVMTDWEVKIFDIEKTPPKATIPASRALALPLDLDFDGISEVILFQEYGIAWIREPFSEWFYVIYWRCPSSCVLINSTTLEEISDVVLEDSRAIFLPPRDIDDDSLLEFFGVSTSSSETLSVYSIMEAVPPVVDIVSPSDGSWVGTYVSVDVSASDELSGVYAVELLINGSSQGYWYPPDYDIYWDATEYAEGTYNLTIVAYDNVNNTASKSIVVHLDKTSPVVGVVSPANGSWVSGVVKISVPVSDVGAGVACVVFGIYGVPELLYNDTVEPYGYSWDTRSYAEGKQLLVVVVKDKAGNYQCVVLEYYVDNTPPSISAVEYPSEVKGGEAAKINVTVSDAKSGVSKVILSYSVDGGKTWTNITATAKGGDTYEATIPGQSKGKTVQFKIIAFDIAGNVAVSPIYSYKVVSGGLAPGISLNLTIGIGVAVAVVAAVVLVVIRRRR